MSTLNANKLIILSMQFSYTLRNCDVLGANFYANVLRFVFYLISKMRAYTTTM